MALTLTGLTFRSVSPSQHKVEDSDQQAMEAAEAVAIKKVTELNRQGLVGFPLSLITIETVAEAAYYAWLNITDPHRERGELLEIPYSPSYGRGIAFDFRYFNKQPEWLQKPFLDLARDLLNTCP